MKITHTHTKEILNIFKIFTEICKIIYESHNLNQPRQPKSINFLWPAATSVLKGEETYVSRTTCGPRHQGNIEYWSYLINLIRVTAKFPAISAISGNYQNVVSFGCDRHLVTRNIQITACTLINSKELH